MLGLKGQELPKENNMNFLPHTLQQIELATRKDYPNEMCGLVLSDGIFIHCENMADDTSRSFIIPITDYFKHKGNIISIVHSHTKKHMWYDIRTPSLADVRAQEKIGIPFTIVGYDGSRFYPPLTFPVAHSPEYIGRAYIYGLQDCGSLLRDFYYYEFDMELTMKIEWSLMEKAKWGEAVKAGLLYNNFQEIPPKSDLQLGDVLVVSIGGGIANHGIIYVDEGVVLNQNETSGFEPLENWLNKIHAIYRHTDFVKDTLC